MTDGPAFQIMRVVKIQFVLYACPLLQSINMNSSISIAPTEKPLKNSAAIHFTPNDRSWISSLQLARFPDIMVHTHGL